MSYTIQARQWGNPSRNRCSRCRHAETVVIASENGTLRRAATCFTRPWRDRGATHVATAVRVAIIVEADAIAKRLPRFEEVLRVSHNPNTTVGQPISQMLYSMRSSLKRLSSQATPVHSEEQLHVSLDPVVIVGQPFSQPSFAPPNIVKAVVLAS